MADDFGKLDWYTTRQRALIPLDERFHVSRSLKRVIQKGTFSTAINKDFEGVARGCMNRENTWITQELLNIYLLLHENGYAHSFETWQDGSLAGGVLGIVIGGAFIGESMFHYRTNASKVAMAGLVEHLKRKRFCLFDAQIQNSHLAKFGTYTITDRQYNQELKACLLQNCQFE